MLYHGNQVEGFMSTYGLGNDAHYYGREFYMTAGVHDLDLNTTDEKLESPHFFE